ncbi:hypothetical protein [Bacillus sp. PS06]|uniref:hypothetical protein n=1 Tax=Bacillus sp. PS06 TaxID=2764176 RepID=UPI001784BE1C|nr:hypothetical protein [Bacillus sp. PS06]MBD8068459.1 hypothetical protein [Bacillus sp. PS06]
MRIYQVAIIQFLIWSLYSFVVWVSKSDGFKSKLILLCIFGYFAFLAANKIGLSRGRAIVTTLTTLSVFFICQRLFWQILF